VLVRELVATELKVNLQGILTDRDVTHHAPQSFKLRERSRGISGAKDRLKTNA
jgi:hypothetical protein